MIKDLVEDAKLYQDVAVELQGAYKDLYQKQVELERKYEEQSNLLKEASVAIQAMETEAKQRHQDLLDVQRGKQFEFNQAISSAVEQYKVQLNAAQSNLQVCDQEHQLMIQQLQNKISLLEVTSASQANLLSVATSNNQEAQGLHSQVFDYILGTVSTKWGAAKYDSQDQVFLFSHKQFRFQDGDGSPNLDPPFSSSQGPKSSTPYCTVSAALQLIKDQTQEGMRCEVEYQLDLCGGVINYQELLKHLSVVFQVGRIKQIFWRSSIVKLRDLKNLRKPSWMSYSCLPTR